MDSDLKKVQKNSDQKQVSKSKTATAPTEPFNSKATELPSILKPKFPSDKVLKKKKSGDMFDLVGQIVIDIVDDNPDDDDRQDEATTVDTVQEGIGATVDVTLVEDVAEKAHEPASTPNVADRLQKPVAKDDNSAPVEEANRKKKEGKDPKNSEEAKKNSKKGKNGTARRSALKGVTIPPVAASLPCPPPPPPLSERKKNVGPKPCVGPAQKNLSSQRKHSSKRNRKGLLRNVAKLWGRKSDGIANPTKAMLSKKYVPPDYGVNPVDFMPDLECYFSKNDITVRDKNKCSKGEVFVEKLPFWLARLPSDDDIPKAQIQAHRPLKQAFEGNPSLLLPKCPRTLPFCEPDSDTLEKFKQVDKQMGTDVPEQASKRLCTNTFYGTLMFEKDKSASEEVKKKKEEPKLKSLGEESVKVNFSFPPKPILFIYSRKNRPRPPVREDDKSHSCKKCHPKNLKPERTFKKKKMSARGLKVEMYYKLAEKNEAETSDVSILIDGHKRKFAVICNGIGREMVDLHYDSKKFPRIFSRERHLYVMFSESTSDGFRLTFGATEREQFLRIMHSLGCLLDTAIVKFSQQSSSSQPPPMRRDSTAVFNNSYNQYTSFQQASQPRVFSTIKLELSGDSCNSAFQPSQPTGFPDNQLLTIKKSSSNQIVGKYHTVFCKTIFQSLSVEVADKCIQTEDLVDLLADDEYCMRKALRKMIENPSFIKAVAAAENTLQYIPQAEQEGLEDVTEPPINDIFFDRFHQPQLEQHDSVPED